MQEAQWFVVAREQVWMAPEHTRPGCEVWRKPVWWSFGYREDEGYRAWLDRFWESHRIGERRFELSNPFWLDHI